jgi:hypothetical protein
MIDLFDGLPDILGSAIFHQEAIVNHLLGQGMLEDILQFRLKGYGLDEVEPFQSS